MALLRYLRDGLTVGQRIRRLMANMEEIQSRGQSLSVHAWHITASKATHSWGNIGKVLEG